MAQLNTYSDISSLAQTVQEDAVFLVRELAQMEGLVTVFNDMTGANTRTGHTYTGGTAVSISELDDLTSAAFTPSSGQVLTPAEIGLQYFITDLRAESEAPESILTDAARDLGFAAVDKVEADVISDMASFTGGTIGTAGSAITWGYLAAAISRARMANKSDRVPLAAVINEYQWAVLAKSASIAGATVAPAPAFQQQITVSGYTGQQFMGVPIYKVFGGIDTSSDFTGGVFPRIALAVDWRRMIRVRPQRDESRRGLELNMSAVYAHGVWRPELGVKMIFDATAPTS